MGLLSGLCSFLIREDRPVAVDLIFVHAGRPERKPFALELFRKGFAHRLVISVGQFEVQEIARLGLEVQPQLQELALQTAPSERHFFVDLAEGRGRAVVCGAAGKGTYEELSALAVYLSAAAIRSILLVSTSVHLRRIGWCCRRIVFFKGKQVLLVAVPEEVSSFRRAGWWRHKDHRLYVISEYAKLLVLFCRFRLAFLSTIIFLKQSPTV